MKPKNATEVKDDDEKTVTITVRLWSDQITPEMRPKHIVSSGTIYLRRNKTHDVKPATDFFGTLQEIPFRIEKLLKKNGITLHPSKTAERKMRRRRS